MWHTADDGVKGQISLAFADALWKKGGTAELHIFAHGPHGLGLAPEHENIKVWPELVAQFLKTVCKFTAE
jgi:dipeptidyl aminopeptidase/acylaminoacyl peptidase